MLIATYSSVQGVYAAEVTVAVAANFAAPMKIIAQQFERDTGHQVRMAFGSTGQFYSQIKNGAPFSILLAADELTPEKIEREALGVVGSRFTYATGRLVLWSKKPGLVNESGAILASGAFANIAIANPKLAPYGAAAVEVLNKLGLMDRLASKIVEGSSVGQAFQFVASGNASIGFVALSQVYENGKIKEGSAWIVPAGMYQPIKQDAILLNAGKGNPAADSLWKYLQGDRARSVMRSFGYEH
jgi:molybdate transport system substrate-binding protein